MFPNSIHPNLFLKDWQIIDSGGFLYKKREMMNFNPPIPQTQIEGSFTPEKEVQYTISMILVK
jgi:hypothetical protein